MTECREVAAAIAGAMAVDWTFETLDEARHYVRSAMLPGESEVVIDNVAWSLYREFRKSAKPARPASVLDVAVAAKNRYGRGIYG